MGVCGHGLSVICRNGRFSALRDVIVFASSDPDSPPVATDLSTDDRYLVVNGEFATYVFDLDEMKISLYRATVHGDEGVWCEENPIQGKEVAHFNTQSGRHYYIQFPFVGDAEFNNVWSQYLAKRLVQISAMKNET
jgi:hypothetical protein